MVVPSATGGKGRVMTVSGVRVVAVGLCLALLLSSCAPRAACNYRVLVGLDLRPCGVVR